jgi:hypothetical protein
MKSDECAASDRHGSGCAGHHVVIAAAMVRVLVADRADDRVFIEAPGQFGTHSEKWTPGTQVGML